MLNINCVLIGETAGEEYTLRVKNTMLMIFPCACFIGNVDDISHCFTQFTMPIVLIV